MCIVHECFDIVLFLVTHARQKNQGITSLYLQIPVIKRMIEAKTGVRKNNQQNYHDRLF